MYKLGITDEEFKAIQDEQGHTERRGLYIHSVKKDNAICVSHDENHQIRIVEIVINNKKIDSKDVANSTILFKTLIKFQDLPEEVYTLHQIAQYKRLDTDIRFVANNLEELKDRICDRFSDGYPKVLGIFDAKGDYNNQYDYTEYNNRYGDGDEEREKRLEQRQNMEKKELKALFWLFGEDFNTFKLKRARKNIPRIIKVFQRNNRRVAIFQQSMKLDAHYGMGYLGGWKHIEGDILSIKTFTPKDNRYNYVSPNREIYISDGKEVWIDDDLFEKLEKSELGILCKKMFQRNTIPNNEDLDEDNEEDYQDCLTDEDSEEVGVGRSDEFFVVLNADKYNQLQSSITLALMCAKRKDMESKAKKKLREDIERQFGKGEVVRCGIKFTKDSMAYEGIEIGGTNFGSYLVSQQIIQQNQPDFLKIYNNFIDFMLDIDVIEHYNWNTAEQIIKYKVQFTKEIDLKVGSIKMKVLRRGNLIYVHLKGRRMTRISKGDISPVLKQAIKYADNPKGYEEYLRATSRANLTLQKELEKGGFSFEMIIDETRDNNLVKGDANALITLPFYRKENKNYVSIKGKEYQVKDTTALFELKRKISNSCRMQSGGGYLQRIIRLLYQTIKDITPDTIGEMIIEGREEYKILSAKIEAEQKAKIENSQVFLNNAIRLTNAEKIKSGYTVRGLSGTLYYIDDDCKVWTVKKQEEKYVNDKYLCIIDVKTDIENEWGKNDAIAKRLLALSKDSVVADMIYEEGDKMDKFWLDIADRGNIITNDIKNDVTGVIV